MTIQTVVGNGMDLNAINDVWTSVSNGEGSLNQQKLLHSGCLGAQMQKMVLYGIFTYHGRPHRENPGLKVKLLVVVTCTIPRSTQRSCSGIRQIPKMCQATVPP